MNQNILEDKARMVRQSILETTVAAQHGHIGSALSCVEILVTLYYEVMKPKDVFILSKGHAVQALYPILADRGILPKEALATFCQPAGLEPHPNRNTPGIFASTGSLGNGIGLGVGRALADRYLFGSSKTYVLCGDGECQEGAIWEAAGYASQHHLNNLTVIIDRNFFQATDTTERINRLEFFVDKWQSFGWTCVEVNGHDYPRLLGAFKVKIPHEPIAIIAYTVKGKGISFMENNPSWHNKIPNKQEVEQARKELYGH